MRRYAAVLFDLFDTLVRFNRDRLPVVTIDGRELRSSVGRIYPVAAAALPGVTLAAFHEAFLWSYREAERRRAADHREIPARARLELCYARLGADPGAVPPEVTDRLLAGHLACLAAAAEPMPGRDELLAWLPGHYRLGIVSNFDYTPTVDRILEQAGLRGRFETVVVSDAVGWRKPVARIFQVAFERLGIRPGESLFVGDRPDIDVAGARGVEMDVAWLNPEGTRLPDGVPAPTYTLRDLRGLRRVLEDAEGETP